jgi:Zn-finger nucleic acid-binding protein
MRPEMRSPVGKGKSLQKTSLEDGLLVYQCPDTSGIYITLQAYWSWLKKRPERLANLPATELGSCVVEAEAQAKLCPETGTIMMRCKVGNDFNFYIDRSKTGGVWLDAGEWDELKSRKFHDEIHLVFTEPWQEKIREQQKQKLSQEMLNEKLGDDLLTEIKKLKETLKDHPHKSYAIAYLEGG